MGKRLDEIKARLGAATRGPWATAERGAAVIGPWDSDAPADAVGEGWTICDLPKPHDLSEQERAANAELIAHAPADLALLAEATAKAAALLAAFDACNEVDELYAEAERAVDLLLWFREKGLA